MQHSPPEHCFAIYTAHNGEADFCNNHALFGRSVPAGTTVSARVTLILGDWSDEQIPEQVSTRKASSNLMH